MSTCSLEFLIAVTCLSAIFLHLPTTGARRAALTLCNAAFLASFIPDGRSWLLLALFLLSGYAAALVLRRWPSSALLAVYLGLLVSSFLVLKKYAFLQLLPLDSVLAHSVRIIGLSYMLFRQIHYVVDAMQGQIKNLSFYAYLNYQLNLFGLVAGPIQRFEQFDDYWRKPRPLFKDRHELLKSYLRIGLGVLKISVVAGLCLWTYESYASSLDPVSAAGALDGKTKLLRFAAIFYLYPAYIYFNFSGYCDVVIGGARLVGLPMPENFVQPYLARNMIDYWTRWHRSLGLWIRDYLFTPMYKSLAQWRPRRGRSLAFLCYFVALFVTGVWHGTTLNFVVFGLLNGVGVAAAKLWEDHLLRRGGRKALRAYLESTRIRAVAVTANLHFVCLTIFFFPSDLARGIRILRNVAAALI